MEIRWLEDFIALAKTRHFSRAADEQNVTQPTFSRRIKLLEEEMKVTLIDRNTLPLSLTPAGDVFLQSAELITRQLRDAKERCQEIRKQEESQITFATTQTLFLSFYKETIEPFCQQNQMEMDIIFCGRRIRRKQQMKFENISQKSILWENWVLSLRTARRLRCAGE